MMPARRMGRSGMLSFLLFFAVSAILSACVQLTSQDEVDAVRRDLEKQATREAGMATEVSKQAARIRDLEESLDRQESLLSYLATRQPVFTPAPSTPWEPTPYLPVRGEVILEEGRCCAGGKAGEVIEITARFSAESPLAEVDKMRYRLGQNSADLDDLAQTSWEPFRESMTFSIQVTLNWVGYTLSVQYMDAVGNLSPVYSDEISVEGSP